MKQYKVTAYMQGLDDNGYVKDGVETFIISENNIQFYKDALNGYHYGCEYIHTYSITEIKPDKYNKTYDIIVNGIYKTGLTINQVKHYQNRGYNVIIADCYECNEYYYNSIEIKHKEY